MLFLNNFMSTTKPGLQPYLTCFRKYEVAMTPKFSIKIPTIIQFDDNIIIC